MTWNPYFEISALVIITILSFYYRQQPYLPIHQSRYFSRLINIEMVLIIFDLMTLVGITWPDLVPMPVNYLVNDAYFIILGCLFYEFYLYVLAITRENERMNLRKWVVVNTPIAVYGGIVLTDGLHEGIYTFMGGEYSHGSLYAPVFLVMTFFYLGLSLIRIARNYQWMEKRQTWAMVFFCIMIWSGFLLQQYVYTRTILISAFTVVGILINFLSLQNPETYRDDKTRTFNQAAFFTYVDERISWKEPVPLMILGFTNYYSLKSIYGENHVGVILRQVGTYLRVKHPAFLTFYVHDGKFVLAAHRKDANIGDLEKDLVRDAENEIRFGEGMVVLRPTMAVLQADDIGDRAEEVLDVLNLAMDRQLHLDAADQVLVIDPEMTEEMEKAQRSRQVLSDAIKKDSVEVYYQPIFGTKEGRVVAAEALARLTDPETGAFIPPDIFIQQAEEDGSIIELGQQIFDKVCAFLHSHDMKALGIHYIEVNLSPAQCVHDDLCNTLITSMRHYEIDPAQINLEITETATKDDDKLKVTMDTLIANGSTFSIDDYGTGFSNLANVLGMPFDIVKLDKSLVWDYFDGKEMILPDLVNMFRKRKYKIVVEGVETAEMATKLSEMGCEYEQGYYYSKAIPGKDFVTYMKEQKWLTA